MAIKDLPKYQDIRSTIRRNGRYPIAKVGALTGINAKDTVVIHHSMTARALRGSNPNSFANTHIDTNGWQGIAYALVIMPDGTIFHCDDLDRRTNHAGNTNDRSVGICIVGDFRSEGANEQPTQEQKTSLYLLANELKKELPKLTTFLGHQECPGYSWKNCPGDTWNYKDVLAGKSVSSNPAPQPAPAPQPVTGDATGLNTGSLVDYLKSVGVDSSFSNRAKLAVQYGIGGYTGSPAQNVQLLALVRSGKTVAAKPAQTPTPKPAPAPKSKYAGGNAKTTSVVDYLKSLGMSSDINARKRIATELGVPNYTGSAAQNELLLRKMRG